MRSIDELATEICTLAAHINAANHRFLQLIAEFDRRTGWSDGGTQSCAHWFHHQAVHEGGFNVEILDDGALRFVRPDGEAVERVLPGFQQPPGDSSGLPAGRFVDCWRGERMDLDLAVDLLIQESRKVGNVPAGMLNA